MIPEKHASGRRAYRVNGGINRMRTVGCLALAANLALINGYGRCDDAVEKRKPIDIIENSIGRKFAPIPEGTFLMGPADPKAPDGEKPRHRVRISEPFHVGVYEVTQGEWTAVMGTTPWKGEILVEEESRNPATYVSWDGATEFCARLTDRERKAGLLKEGEAYRLPTEAEWEYACSAGSATQFHFGDPEESLGEYAWYGDNALDEDEKYAHVVGRKRANAWGLFDTHGNVYEWCSDRYGKDYYGESPKVDPQGPPEGACRVFRGGAWLSLWAFCRSADRCWDIPSLRSSAVGFRVVRDAGPRQ